MTNKQPRPPRDYAPRTGSMPPVGHVPGWVDNAIGACLMVLFLVTAWTFVTLDGDRPVARSPGDCNQSTMKR